MRSEKQFLLDELLEKVETSPSFIITSYNALKVNKSNELRAQLDKVSGELEIARKRVLIKAFEKAGINFDGSLLKGHIGIVLVKEDAVETTKAIFDYAEENKDIIEVIGGRVDGTLYNAADMEKLSKLPGMDQMRAQFLGLLEAPMSQTVSTMHALLTSIMYCLENKAEKEQG